MKKKNIYIVKEKNVKIVNKVKYVNIVIDKNHE